MAVLALVSLSILVYTYVGYPVLIGLLARLSPLRLREDPAYLPAVTACIPVFDAERYVDEKVESLLALDYPQKSSKSSSTPTARPTAARRRSRPSPRAIRG